MRVLTCYADGYFFKIALITQIESEPLTAGILRIQGQIQIHILMADVHRRDRTMAHRAPFAAQLGTGACPQFIMKHNGLTGKILAQLGELFLYASTAPGR